MRRPVCKSRTICSLFETRLDISTSSHARSRSSAHDGKNDWSTFGERNKIENTNRAFPKNSETYKKVWISLIGARWWKWSSICWLRDWKNFIPTSSKTKNHFTRRQLSHQIQRVIVRKSGWGNILLVLKVESLRDEVRESFIAKIRVKRPCLVVCSYGVSLENFFTGFVGR